ncbi:MAG: thioredoxin family protein [Bacteroidales bacterium]|nr:thioredoxin family protein [Bacteroidales bacterium]
MRRILVLLLTLLALSSARADDIQWFTTLDAAKTEAQHTGHPIFFNCYVDWAGGSVLMDSIVLREPLMTEWISQHFVPLRINMQTPDGKRLAEHYGIDGYAYYLVLDAEGEVVHRISGGAKAPEFKALLEQSLSPKTSLRGTRQSVESPWATAADTASYLRALRVARDGDTFRTVGRDFALRQPVDQYLQSDYWPFAILAMHYHGPYFRHLIEHKEEYNLAHGEQSVNNLMESVLTREVRPWAEGQMQPIAARSDLDAVLSDIAACQLPDTSATLLLGGMALLRTDHRYVDLLELMDHSGHLLHRYPGVRSGLELTFNFPDMTAADSTALIDYLDRAVEREKAVAGGRMTRAAQQLADMRAALQLSAAKAQAGDSATLSQMGAAGGVAAPTATGIDFVHGPFAEALAQAVQEQKLVFMDCKTVWCGPCRAMAKNVFTLPRVGEFFRDRFVSVMMDMETGEGPDLSHRYKVKAYPTMLVLDAEGNELGRIVGYRDAEAFLTEVQNILAAPKK